MRPADLLAESVRSAATSWMSSSLATSRAAEKAVAGELEFVGVAGGEDEFAAGSAEAMGEREAEAAGAAGDDRDHGRE